MIDFLAMRVSGAIELARVRVLWDDGVIKMFDKRGLVWWAISDKPQKKKGRWLVNRWTAKTTRGEIEMKSRCITCGGWRKVTRIVAQELWDEQGA